MGSVMIRLRREMTFWISLADLGSSDVPQCQGYNSWVGYPPAKGLGFPLHVACLVAGDIDHDTGMVLNVHELDKRLRQIVWPKLIDAIRKSAGTPEGLGFEQLLGAIWPPLLESLPSVARLVELTLFSSPRLQYTMSAPHKMVLCEQFEFSASHRLFNANWTPEKNHQVFGKCSRPGGHGHNYLLEVSVAASVLDESGRLIAIEAFEKVVKQEAIDRLDHRNLDTDISELQGSPSTAENLAAMIYGWLENQFVGVELESVRVYETPKTYAECRGST